MRRNPSLIDVPATADRLGVSVRHVRRLRAGQAPDVDTAPDSHGLAVGPVPRPRRPRITLDCARTHCGVDTCASDDLNPVGGARGQWGADQLQTELTVDLGDAAAVDLAEGQTGGRQPLFEATVAIRIASRCHTWRGRVKGMASPLRARVRSFLRGYRTINPELDVVGGRRRGGGSER